MGKNDVETNVGGALPFDVSLCTNNLCLIRKDCRRSELPPPHIANSRQVYSYFDLEIDGTCKHFIKNETN